MVGVDTYALAVRLKAIFDKDVQAGRQPYRRALQAGIDEDVVDRILVGRRIPSASTLDTLLDGVLITDKERAELQAMRSSIIRILKAERGEEAVRREPYVPKSGQPDPIGISSPLELQQALQAVHVWGGRPSLRKLERRSDGVLRRSTVSDMLRGEPAVPDYDRYLAFLGACGVDNASLDAWVYTWRRLSAQKQPKIASWAGGMTPA
ncbi:hypothetical protein [Streptomyces clavifer]|uniref:hypothetical protein n=1 Tax=Streptomyces clavifer TaxID=68188 RepID=UPI003722CFA1